MTYMEIDKALIDILAEKKQACEARLTAIPKENKTEKKALHLELGMYTLCQNAGFLINTTGGREGVLRTRRTVIGRILAGRPELQAVYTALSEEEQIALLATDGLLVKRPILVGDDFVLTGFRQQEWDEKVK